MAGCLEHTARTSYGIARNGRTPLKKLRDAKAMISDPVLTFPVLLMEDVVKRIGPAMKWFESCRGRRVGHELFKLQENMVFLSFLYSSTFKVRPIGEEEANALELNSFLC